MKNLKNRAPPTDTATTDRLPVTTQLKTVYQTI